MTSYLKDKKAGVLFAVVLLVLVASLISTMTINVWSFVAYCVIAVIVLYLVGSQKSG